MIRTTDNPTSEPMQSEALNMIGFQLEQDVQIAREREVQQGIEIGFQMGRALEKLISEKMRLEFENRGLKNEITQLKVIHVTELNAAMEMVTAKIQMAAEKVKAIVEKLELFGKQVNSVHIIGCTISDDAILFSTLYKQILQVSCEDLKKYPEYSDIRMNKSRPCEELSISLVSFSDALILSQSYPILKNSTEKTMEGIEVLKRETAQARAANIALIDQKEIIIDFHEQYLTKIGKQIGEIRLKKVLGLVSATYNRIQWEKLIKVASDRYSQSNYSPTDISFFLNEDQIPLNKKIAKIQERVKNIIEMFKSNIN